MSSSAFLLTGTLFLGACASVPGAEVSARAIEALERGTLDAGNAPLGYLRAGDPDAPRLLFVHGSPGDAEAWADFLIEPLPGWESLAVDRPGYGRSDQGPVVELEGQARALEPFLEQRAGRWPVLVGHSLGGPIIARVAANHPERVGGLVIIAGSLDPKLECLRWYNYLAKAFAWILPGPLRRSNQEMWDLRTELVSLAADLERISCPVLIIHGRKDGLVPFANVAFLQQALSGSERVEVEDWPLANHFLLWEQPYASRLRERLEAFLGSEQWKLSHARRIGEAP